MSTIFSKTNPSGSRGFSLLETLIYVAIMGFFFAVVVANVVVITRSHRGLAATRELEQSASVALDRLVREIRAAATVNNAQSTFGSHPGVLSIEVRDENTETYDTIEFSVSDDRLILSHNGTSQGSLTSEAVRVTNLVFQSITTASSTAIKIEMELQSSTTDSIKTETFYHTAILRESYI